MLRCLLERIAKPEQIGLVIGQRDHFQTDLQSVQIEALGIAAFVAGDAIGHRIKVGQDPVRYR
jgi:hypothetical protein